MCSPILASVNGVMDNGGQYCIETQVCSLNYLVIELVKQDHNRNMIQNYWLFVLKLSRLWGGASDCKDIAGPD